MDIGSQEELGVRSIRPAQTWSEFCSLRWRGLDKPKSRLGKVGIGSLLKEAGLPHLTTLRTFNGAEHVSLDGLPDFCVLKPSSLWSGRGVMLLHRIAGMDFWYDAKSQKVYSEKLIVSSCRNLEEKVGRQLTFMVEERALDQDRDKVIPLDYKVFTFYGDCKFILQVDRNFAPPRMAFFDGNFAPITDGRVVIPDSRPELRGEHRRPICFEGILDLARALTTRLRAAFVSVDCYATPDGPMFGELTHTPGGPWYGLMYYFSDDFDQELGGAWREANKRLGFEQAMVSLPYQIKLNGKVLRTIT